MMMMVLEGVSAARLVWVLDKTAKMSAVCDGAAAGKWSAENQLRCIRDP